MMIGRTVSRTAPAAAAAVVMATTHRLALTASWTLTYTASGDLHGPPLPAPHHRYDGQCKLKRGFQPTQRT